jgi:hypothetical protein
MLSMTSMGRTGTLPPGDPASIGINDADDSVKILPKAGLSSLPDPFGKGLPRLIWAGPRSSSILYSTCYV